MHSPFTLIANSYIGALRWLLQFWQKLNSKLVYNIFRKIYHLGPVYMRGGTGRLPGRDDARDPDMYMFP